MTTNKVLFKDYELKKEILDAISKKGFESPTEIQEKTLNIALESDHNIVGKAQTGTGKTAAFGLPILNTCDPKLKKVQALILCPTRELANQVNEELRSLKGDVGLFVSPIYGGSSYEKQNKALKMGDQIIVGTPGRIIDHLKKKTLKLDALKYMVLDEADEMLNMGFLEEINQILEFVPKNAKRYLFSATLPRKIQDVVKKYVPNHELIEVKSQNKVTKLSKQKLFKVQEQQKIDALAYIIQKAEDFYGIVFCRTKVEVERLKENLIKLGHKTDCIHGDIPQNRREKVLHSFRNKKINILIATDVAARGIDIQDLNHVINYHLPENAESYVHRVGRTGRAGKSGTAITLVSCKEFNQYKLIKKINQIDFEEIEPPTLDELRKVHYYKIEKELAKIQAKSRFYEDIKDDLLEQFEPNELLLKLIQKAYPKANQIDFLPINEKAGSRGGGRRRSRSRFRRFDKGSNRKSERNYKNKKRSKRR